MRFVLCIGFIHELINSRFKTRKVIHVIHVWYEYRLKISHDSDALSCEVRGFYTFKGLGLKIKAKC